MPPLAASQISEAGAPPGIVGAESHWSATPQAAISRHAPPDDKHLPTDRHISQQIE
jgi:hypothetical protein